MSGPAPLGLGGVSSFSAHRVWSGCTSEDARAYTGDLVAASGVGGRVARRHMGLSHEQRAGAPALRDLRSKAADRSVRSTRSEVNG